MDELDLRWRALCSEEFQRRKALSEATYTQPASADVRKLLREWWGNVEALLRFSVENPHQEIPLDLLNALGGFAGYLAVGKIPSPIADAATEGNSGPGPSERRDIGRAVAYLTAATRGIDHAGMRIVIDDRAPVKTICEAFGVARTTVQGWRRNSAPSDTNLPSVLGANPIDGPILERLMRDAAERYRQAGRSHAAVRKRGTSN